VVWSIPLKSWSNATPVIYKKRIFFCEEPSTLVSVDLRKAEVLWRAAVDYEDLSGAADQKTAAAMKAVQARRDEFNGEVRTLNEQYRAAPQDKALLQQIKGRQAEINKLNLELRQLKVRTRQAGKPPTHVTNGYSSPTPVAAGKRVFVLFGYGGAAAFDLKGRRLWARLVEKSVNGWGHSASPVVTDGKLILHINRTVHALDPGSGEELWTAPSASTWGTPLPLRIGKERALLTTGGDLIRCGDGKVVATGVGLMPWTSPIERDGVIYIVDQRGAFAFRVPAKLEDATTVEKIWQSKPASDRYYASPVVHDGLLYAITQRGIFSVLDIKDGTVVYEKKLNLRGTMYPSISLAGGRLFVSDDQGTTLVLEPGREYRELGANSLEAFRSTPVFEGRRIYVRTLKSLFSIGEE